MKCIAFSGNAIIWIRIETIPMSSPDSKDQRALVPLSSRTLFQFCKEALPFTMRSGPEDIVYAQLLDGDLRRLPSRIAVTLGICFALKIS
jgi:hypothetical protein